MTAPPPAADPTIDAFTDALWLEDGLSKNTLAAYRRDLALFAHWLHAQRGKPLNAASESDLQAYMGARLSDRGKATSANRRLTVFKRYYRWALREHRVAADPSLRDELDTILRDDYGQGAQTQEQTRRQTIEPNREKPAPEPESEPEPAPDEARTPATRQQTQARADNPRPAGKEQKPKPIRSKKALLERFKTRLNENLAEQKNHMPPTQNRDRTPRKGR